MTVYYAIRNKETGQLMSIAPGLHITSDKEQMLRSFRVNWHNDRFDCLEPIQLIPVPLSTPTPVIPAYQEPNPEREPNDQPSWDSFIYDDEGRR